MAKRLPLGTHFQKLDVLTKRTVRADAIAGLSAADKTEAAAVPLASSFGSILEDRVIAVDSEQVSQPQNKTLSKTDTVTNVHEPSRTVSKDETSGEKRTVSNMNTVQIESERQIDAKAPALQPTGYYTRVANELLRQPGRFEDPIDFMIYMHLYTYAQGFGRKTVSMSQGQLERFTSSSKNTVKRSLERLVVGRWIKLVDEYEHGRVSRSWLILACDTNDPKNSPKRGSGGDSVKREQCEGSTDSVSRTDTPTLSKSDTYKETNKESFKETLSPANQSSAIGEYLATLKPPGKRESESRHFRELLKAYAEQQVNQALTYLQKQGLPGSGAVCHSPMAYLAQAIEQVLAASKEDAQRESKRKSYEAAERNAIAQEAAEEARFRAQERAFEAAMPDTHRQSQFVAQVASKYSGLALGGAALRSLAVSAWAAENYVHL